MGRGHCTNWPKIQRYQSFKWCFRNVILFTHFYVKRQCLLKSIKMFLLLLFHSIYLSNLIRVICVFLLFYYFNPQIPANPVIAIPLSLWLVMSVWVMALGNGIESTLYLNSVKFLQFPVISRINSFMGGSEQLQSKKLVFFEFSIFSFPLKSEFPCCF